MEFDLHVYAEFLETVPDPALLVDAHGRVVMANGLAEQQFRFRGGSLEQTMLSTLLPSGHRRQHEQKLATFFANPQQRSMGGGRSYAGQRADGSVFDADIMLSPVRVGGRGTLALCIVRDVTERVRLEADLRDAIERERRLAHSDALTGVTTGRHFGDLALRELGRSARYGHTISLAAIDLDRFRMVNEQFGHGAGDELLRLVARKMSAELRSVDLLARMGGDEFVLLMPETGLEGAVSTLQRLRERVAEALAPRPWSVTLSVGIASCARAPRHVDDLIAAAGRQLARVKDEGRDGLRAAWFDDPPPAAPVLPVRPAASGDTAH